MKADDVVQMLRELDLQRIVDRSQSLFFDRVLESLSSAPGLIGGESDALQGPLAMALERLGIESEGDVDERKGLFDFAFLCRRSADIDALTQRDRILHYFYLCNDAVLSDRQIELSMLLRELDLENVLAIPTEVDWAEELLLRSARAFIFLSRKGGGWGDVQKAVAEVHLLRELQALRESSYLSGEDGSEKVGPVVVGYNLARIVDLVGQYAIEGGPSDALVQVDRHTSNITKILAMQSDAELDHAADLLRLGAGESIRSSIWFTTRRLGRRIRDFVDVLTAEAREHPVLDLWPSQQRALGSQLLDPAKRAIVVEMPTSAGKTLIAEFATIQSLALNPESRVAYVVPTRALVNQVTHRFRSDLGPLGYSVEAAIPVFDLDPTEDVLLRQPIDVLVTTPEKLDLLVRAEHPSVTELSLVIADEAHNLGEGSRGARLEFLLATLRRERSDARFLLLTPFVPNADQLASWLGDDQDASIKLRWKPNERITAAARWKKRRGGPYELKLLTLPSAGNVDVTKEVEVDLGAAQIEGSHSKKRVSTSVALRLAKRGGVLVLARGRKTAEDRAKEIADHLPAADLGQFATSVLHYAQSELGVEHRLPELIKKGVAYHHAGLSHEMRYLLELLIDQEEIGVVVGTTTLAQGVNFPIASVVMETVQKPSDGPSPWEDFSYAEFWNIAGRAGRALRDRLGLVVFPVKEPAQLAKVKDFLRGEAQELASALVDALAGMTALGERFDRDFVRRNPSLSVFLQYLTHATRVAGLETGRSELEDLLRSSLVYHQVREENRGLAEKLVDLATRYLDVVQEKNPGYLALADGTGFSLSSVDYIYAVRQQAHPEFSTTEFWSPEGLFGEPERLSSVISVLAEVPELSLGRTDFGIFNPDAVAGVVQQWVTGATVSEIADKWFSAVEEDPDARRRKTAVYLYSKLVGQIPWGIGAIQRLSLTDPEQWKTVGHIPSLIFYGVATKEAAELRMAGVPRIAAEGLAQQWKLHGNPDSFADVRHWLSQLDNGTWNAALPAGTPLTGRDCVSVWKALGGVPV